MASFRKKIQRFFGSEPASPKQARSRGKELLETARERFKAGQTLEALKFTREAAAAPDNARGLWELQGHCLSRLGRHADALQAYQAELRLFPDNEKAKAHHEKLVQSLRRPAAELVATAERSWHTSLPRETLRSLQRALHHYHYRGVPLLKNPFDFAIYPMLIWKTKPRTLLEIGSKDGGSAYWFGDLLNTFGIDGHIHSLDIIGVETLSHPRVTFHEGDGRALEKAWTPDFLATLPRPWLIIEDADHEYETSIAVLRFFHPYLRPGEYIVVEDGIITDLSEGEDSLSGPHRAIREFLSEHGSSYRIDRECCDFFGYNVTWCTNGYLQRLEPVPTGEAESPSSSLRATTP